MIDSVQEGKARQTPSNLGNYQLVKQSRLKVESLGLSERNFNVRHREGKSSLEDFVNYSWKIVVYQSHTLFFSILSFQVIETVYVLCCASIIFANTVGKYQE